MKDLVVKVIFFFIGAVILVVCYLLDQQESSYGRLVGSDSSWVSPDSTYSIRRIGKDDTASLNRIHEAIVRLNAKPEVILRLNSTKDTIYFNNHIYVKQ